MESRKTKRSNSFKETLKTLKTLKNVNLNFDRKYMFKYYPHTGNFIKIIA
jgi:hypothetical protein